MRIPVGPPNWHDVFAQASDPAVIFEKLNKKEMQSFVRQANDTYLHWDKLRFHPVPGDDPKLAWTAVKMARSPQLEPLPLTYYNDSFRYWVPPKQQEWLSFIDKKGGGYLPTRTARPIPDDNDRYLYNSLMEEAIASSMLEGAVTTREVAKEMLRTKRPPRDKAE